MKYPQLSDKEWLANEVALKPLKQIADEVGCSYSAVVNMMKKYGITVPKHRQRRFTEEQRARKSASQKAAYALKYPEGRFAENHPNWKGGRQNIGDYIAIYMPDHPRAKTQGRVFEHILVAEKTLGRYLTKDEVVHHINGDKRDNRPENLEVMLRTEHHKRHHVSGKNIMSRDAYIAYLQSLLDTHGIEYESV